MPTGHSIIFSDTLGMNFSTDKASQTGSFEGMTSEDHVVCRCDPESLLASIPTSLLQGSVQLVLNVLLPAFHHNLSALPSAFGKCIFLP